MKTPYITETFNEELLKEELGCIVAESTTYKVPAFSCL